MTANLPEKFPNSKPTLLDIIQYLETAGASVASVPSGDDLQLGLNPG